MSTRLTFRRRRATTRPDPARPLVAGACLALALLTAGCRSFEPAPTDGPARAAAPERGAAPLQAAAAELPAHAAPDARLLPLQFLVGRWLTVNANTTVNEEHWMPPRGSVMLGTFRQVRLDGRCAFVELSQIAVEDGEVVLRLRHLHGKLEVPTSRAEPSLFRLKSVGDRRVEFSGTGGAEGVTSVVYELTAADELSQAIGFDPEKSREKPFTQRYRRDRSQP